MLLQRPSERIASHIDLELEKKKHKFLRGCLLHIRSKFRSDSVVPVVDLNMKRKFSVSSKQVMLLCVHFSVNSK